MVALFLMTTISCSDALQIIHRITRVVGLTTPQKTELIQTIKESIPFCPVKVVPDERPKSSSR